MTPIVQSGSGEPGPKLGVFHLGNSICIYRTLMLGAEGAGGSAF